MKRFWALALLLLSGGCLSTSARTDLAENPSSSQAVASVSETGNSSLPAPGAAGAGQKPDLYLPSLLSDPGFPAPFLEDIPTLQADAELFGEEDTPADPETLEDNQVLSGENQAPPEDEGMTVPAQEVTFDFPVVENEKVRYFIDYFSGPAQQTFGRWLERSGRYLPLMREIFAEEGLPQDLAYLSMIESGFNDRAYSWANAAGLWQFIESTGKLYGLQNDWWRDERRDPIKATRAAARHLGDLNRLFDGDWYLSVPAYNAGAGKIQRAVSRYDSRDFWKLSRGPYLQKETKNYLPKMMAALLIAKEPEKYGFSDLEYQEPLAFDVVKVPTSTDLEIIADLSDTTYEEIKGLNPELKRWCTPPGIKDYEVRIPPGTKEGFLEKYALVPKNKRANYERHRVKRGDTLLALANRYKIQVSDIVAMNHIKNPRALRVGMDLILPLHAGQSRLPVEELADDYLRTRRPTYTVRKGDSLWKIAQRFNVSEKQLRVWNRLGWKNIIRPGQTLVVSGKSGRGTVTARKNKVRKIVYQVRAGDTLWGIGRRFDVATRQIMDWNNLSENHVLQPGDDLTLMVQDGSRG